MQIFFSFSLRTSLSPSSFFLSLPPWNTSKGDVLTSPLVFSSPPALPSQMLLIGNRRKRKEKGRRNHHHLGSSTSWSSSFQYWRQSGSGRGEKDGIGRFLPFSISFFFEEKRWEKRDGARTTTGGDGSGFKRLSFFAEMGEKKEEGGQRRRKGAAK